uniref:Uncharacterized protein n=1 Tax=viral metagenome TaxID=1070528 RepID=A0A6M3JD47_9ZZZZ
MAATWERIGTRNPRVVTVASSATPTPNADITDMYIITALAEAAEFGAPTGTPKNGQKLLIRVKDNATPRALTWNAIYAGTLPSTTAASVTLYMICIYNEAATKWDVTVRGDLTLVAAATGFTITGGTTPKTLTVENTSLVDQDLTSDAGPTFDHLHIAGAGGVLAAAAGAAFCNQNPTNTGIASVGNAAQTTLTDNQRITFTMTAGVPALFTVTRVSNGYGAVFAAEYGSATITKIHDPSAQYEITDTDTAKIAVFKSAASNVINIKNYANTTIGLRINVFGPVASATAPAP